MITAGSRTRTVLEKHWEMFGLSVCQTSVRFSRGPPPPQISSIMLSLASLYGSVLGPILIFILIVKKLIKSVSERIT